MDSSQKAHPESERRQATVMFADISGFTAMSEKMDPEEVTTTMNALFAELGDIIEEHGGTIDKFIGDCIMAVFGVPKAIENAPVRAVSSAVVIKQCVDRFSAGSGVPYPLDIHIGINTGEVIAGMIGSAQKREYTVMGDTVNLASRLEDQSDAGQILVSLTTYRAASNQFDFDELQPVTLKGKEKPVPVFRVKSKTSISHEANGSASSRIISSALIGREEELNRLELNVFKLLSGDGGIVNIIGEAGIGKSRLLEELQQKEEIRKVTLLEGQAISVGRSLSFFPLVDLIKRYAGITDEDGVIEAFDKLDKCIRRILGADAETVLPFIATMMRVPLPGKYQELIETFEKEALPSYIVSNVKTFFQTLAAQRPLVLLFEDMQWADSSSIEILESIMRMTASHPILLILVMRPRYWETSDKLVLLSESVAASKSVTLHLNPLSESQSKLLLQSLLNDSALPPNFINNIVRKSEGNPFFIEEVIRSLLDSGTIDLSKEGFSITGDDQNLNIPSSIQDIVMSRVDRLDAQTRDLIRAAAVVGRSFLVRVLEQIAKQIEDVDGKLSYLGNIQIIRQRQNAGEIEYIFKHALAHEAIYQSILLQTRKALHLSVAKAIESIFPERMHEFFGMLAFHFGRAENIEKSEEYLLKAGEAALQSAASTEALHYYHEALNLYKLKFKDNIDPLKLAQLEKNTAQAYYNKGLYVETVEHLTNALSHFRYQIPDSTKVTSLINLANVVLLLFLLYLPRWMRSRKLDERDAFLIEIMVQLSVTAVMVRPRHTDYAVYLLFRKCSALLADVNKSIKTIILGVPSSFAFLGIHGRVGNSLAKKISTLVNRDITKDLLLYELNKLIYNYSAGIWDTEYNESLLDEALIQGELQSANCYYFWLGMMWVDMGRIGEYQALVSKLEKITSKYENQESLLHQNIIKGYYLLKIGDYSNAKSEIESAVAIGENTGLVLMKYFSLALLMEIFAGLGEFESARKINGSLEALAKSVKNVYLFSRARHKLAGFYSELLQARQAQSASSTPSSRKAMGECRQIVKSTSAAAARYAPIRIEAYRHIGTYFLLAGNARTAWKWWKKSILSGERLGAQLELARTYLELSQRRLLHADAPDFMSKDAAKAYLEKASSIFEQTGSEADLRACLLLQHKINSAGLK